MIEPTKQDKFSFGLWTIGWQARDTFGDATLAGSKRDNPRLVPIHTPPESAKNALVLQSSQISPSDLP